MNILRRPDFSENLFLKGKIIADINLKDKMTHLKKLNFLRFLNLVKMV